MDAADSVNAVAVGRFNGKPVIISGGDDGSGGGKVEIWDAVGGQRLHAMDTNGSVYTVAVGRFNGKPVIISGSGSSSSGDKFVGKVEIWDAVGGQRLHAMDTGGSVYTVAVGRFNGKPVIISGSGSSSSGDKFVGKVEIWDAVGGQRLHAMETADFVSAVAVGQFNGQPVIISGGGDLLQVWATSLPADLLSDVCAQVSRPLTPAEWIEHIGIDDAFRQVCPDQGSTYAPP
ncbi:hypothetical protein [Rhizohabitans arisaemae]|uniref:hypothetical protein n=1 Tax=Rhizohabitans arisaemae TaxID=2720610 RepID=UPI0024B14284|nr:hypothetical protein [Rhizohabitans arisaemae]